MRPVNLSSIKIVSFEYENPFDLDIVSVGLLASVDGKEPSDIAPKLLNRSSKIKGGVTLYFKESIEFSVRIVTNSLDVTIEYVSFSAKKVKTGPGGVRNSFIECPFTMKYYTTKGISHNNLDRSNPRNSINRPSTILDNPNIKYRISNLQIKAEDTQ